MKRQVLFASLTVTLLLLPSAALAQAEQAAAKADPQSKTEESQAQKPAPADAAKPAQAATEVKSALDVLAYELAGEDILTLDGTADAIGSYVRLVARIDDAGIGASLAPVGDTLQAQLKLTKGQGLVVTAVNADSPAAKAGLQVDDILLSAGERPLAKPSDVSDVIKSPVKKPFTVEFTVLRGGERRNVSLTVADSAASVLHLAVRSLEAPTYRIGVEVSDASSTLRTQLKLPKDQGIVIDRVLPDSPAQKVGFQGHDVLLAVDGKPLAKSEDLSAAVKASEGRALKFAVMRGGQKIDVAVTPEKQTDKAYRVRTRLSAQNALLRSYSHRIHNEIERPVLTEVVVRQRKPAGETQAQLERVLKQIDELRDSVKALQGTVSQEQKAKPTSKTDPPTKTEPSKK